MADGARPGAAAAVGPIGAGGLERLHPAYFALVMATGIISIAAHLTGWRLAAHGLFWLNLVAYPVLWALTILRAARHRRAFLADFSDHARGPGFFTAIAATCVLGSQFVVIGAKRAPALVLWWFGIALWAVLIYSVLTLLTVRAEKPPIEKGINGGWLVAVVASQSVSVLGSQLAPGMEQGREVAVFFCLVMWLGGGMLYIWTITLIFYRYTFFPMSPGDLTPPYWINMGAVAISTLAGTFLVANAGLAPFMAGLLPFLRGMTLLFWATATWWIPMLVTLGFWRHVVRRMPLTYDPLYWGAVFPLGMYTVCTYRVAETMEVPWLRVVPAVFVHVAAATWIAVFAALVMSLGRALLTRARKAG